MKLFKSLRFRLIFWYISTLIIFAVYFYLFVHILVLKNGTLYFILLFILFAVVGSFIIFRITNSITYLTAKMRQISRKNLDERVEGIISEDEIGELSLTFNSLLDRLNDAFKREQQFIADVAHEIKTPIATLVSSFEVTLSKKRGTAEYEKVLKDAIQDTNRIASTLKNVLDLTWADSPSNSTIETKCNLSELMNEMEEIGKSMSRQKKIAIYSHIPKEIYTFGHKEKLARAVLNIIDNAVKYTGEGGSVYLKLTPESKRVIISIKDTGQGIVKEDLPFIFDRFYRGSRTKKQLGSGIGLAISKSIVLQHKGHIQVKSTVGKGTTFFIILPQA